MRIGKIYDRSTEELKSRLNKFIDSLPTIKLPGDISISNISRKWQGDRMLFSFGAAKNFFRTSVSGEINISGSSIVLDVNILKIVSSFVEEAKLRAMIQNKIDEVLLNVLEVHNSIP